MYNNINLHQVIHNHIMVYIQNNLIHYQSIYIYLNYNHFFMIKHNLNHILVDFRIYLKIHQHLELL